MILPNKHLALTRSLLFLGGEVLDILAGRSAAVSAVWEELRARDSRVSFEQFTLAASFLFALGAVEFEGQFLRRKTG